MKLKRAIHFIIGISCAIGAAAFNDIIQHRVLPRWENTLFVGNVILCCAAGIFIVMGFLRGDD